MTRAEILDGLLRLFRMGTRCLNDGRDPYIDMDALAAEIRKLRREITGGR